MSQETPPAARPFYLWIVTNSGFASYPKIRKAVFRHWTATGATVWDRGGIKHHRRSDGTSLHEDEASALTRYRLLVAGQIQHCERRLAQLTQFAAAPPVEVVPEGRPADPSPLILD